MDSTLLFPLFLKLEGRRVLVVGGGAVGARKVNELLEAKASVVVVDPSPSEEIARRANERALTLRRRTFHASDVDGTWLVVAATDDHDLNARVAEACEARRVFCNAVDDPRNSSSYFASIVRRPPITVAISSNGEAPALSKLLRELVEQLLPEDDWIERARALRRRWREEGTPMSSRFGELVRALGARSA